MTNIKWCNTRRGLRALGTASLFVVVCGSVPALAEDGSDTGLDENAEAVSNNFGELLKGMGQELKKVIGSDHTSESADEQDKNKEADQANDTSAGDVKGK